MENNRDKLPLDLPRGLESKVFLFGLASVRFPYERLSSYSYISTMSDPWISAWFVMLAICTCATPAKPSAS